MLSNSYIAASMSQLVKWILYSLDVKRLLDNILLTCMVADQEKIQTHTYRPTSLYMQDFKLEQINLNLLNVERWS